MALPARPVAWLGPLFLVLLFSGFVRAECGTKQQCIGVSIDPTVAPAHGTPHVSAPLNFGNQTVSTVSTGKPILVAAVLGPIGTHATINSITLGGADAAEFNIASTTCTVGSPSLRHNGQQQASLNDACTVSVTFNPAGLGSKTASVAVASTAITRTIPLTGKGTGALPAAAGASVSVQVNTTATFDLTPFVSGLNLQGIRVTTPPSHGKAVVKGNRVIYTPTTDYVGSDQFSYESFSGLGSSGPASVAVTVTPRPDPTRDLAVLGMVEAQARTVRRFSRAQILNFQRRMESLHNGAAGAGVTSSGLIPGHTEHSAAAVPFDSLAMIDQDSSSFGGASPHGGGEAALSAASFLNPIMGVVANNSLALSSSSEVGGGWLPEGLGVWVGGNIDFGNREGTGSQSGLEFSTDGISVGVDGRFSDTLTLGAGLGYARDATDIGSDGSRTRSRGWSVTGYGSYQPSPTFFVDGLLGYGDSDHDTDRFAATAGGYARGDRDAHQYFGSMAAGYERRGEGWLLSPYGRVDAARDTLDGYTESGAGDPALRYSEETFSSLQLSLGLRAETTRRTHFGRARTRFIVEYGHGFADHPGATIVYADRVAGPSYVIASEGVDRNTLLTGFGADFIFRDGLSLGIDYQAEHFTDLDTRQAVHFWLSKEFGSRNMLPYTATTLFDNPIGVGATYTYEDNLNRAVDNKIWDHVYSLNISQAGIFPISRHVRVVVRGLLNPRKLHTYSGLDRFSAGAHGELQYRPSGRFGAPTLALFARGTADLYESSKRDGFRFAAGASARQSLTDRVQVFGALAGNWRKTDYKVFTGQDYSARLQLDLALTRASTLYLGGEYRRGDAVSSDTTALTAVATPDDAFPGRGLFASRYDARTWLWRLGLNWSLGPNDSLDISWVRAHSKPTDSGSYLPTYGQRQGSTSYKANQYSIAYLMRF